MISSVILRRSFCVALRAGNRDLGSGIRDPGIRDPWTELMLVTRQRPPIGGGSRFHFGALGEPIGTISNLELQKDPFGIPIISDKHLVPLGSPHLAWGGQYSMYTRLAGYVRECDVVPKGRQHIALPDVH